MITVNINEVETKELIRQQVADLVKDIDAEMVYWDTNELKRRTCMSWNTIQDLFFFDSRFPKHKIGGKWYFPAKATREFLLVWLSEQ
ncbi:hypothetical protein Back11_11370 [Paenibacillus baekrokdamisoli]|uniref:Uncharacterized protein n=1 Tax=Paenibacillus baekrokdamisoli TaxID=1712516 RepID=A0A3G9INI3_9BACL|nr:group-specific protein [Paenibacillus baekrokdamisoli]MBB3070438.1 hypothetical protein [Paenibacillus baekrokdamisoli]BBH19792.1 hypothetical protein Back11_11370 [Paenibacillus baekrokdamisoli]